MFRHHVAMTIDILSQDTTFLEACIENHTKSNLYMDQVEFEPTQNWSATKLKVDEHHSEKNSAARCVYLMFFKEQTDTFSSP